MDSPINDQLNDKIVPQLDTLCREGKVGFCEGTVWPNDIRSGRSFSVVPNITRTGDRFRLDIPFAGSSLNWDVLFNCCQPEDPPDFIFHDDDFMPDIEYLPSLAEWNCDQPESLLNVIKEILALYASYQVEKIFQDSRFRFEYESLVNGGLIKEDSIEVYYVPVKKQRGGLVNFLIRLPIDFSNVSHLTRESHMECSAILLVTYHIAEAMNISSQLFLSANLEEVLGDSKSIKIPVYPVDGCLLDYVPLICEIIENKIGKLYQGFNRRLEYISFFKSSCEGSVLEFDTDSAYSISCLMEWHDFFFILKVNLTDRFPEEQPCLSFQSIYHDGQDGQPYCSVVHSYPYSPRWSSSEMVQRTKTEILKQVGLFQKSSIKEGVLST